jgi:hypothetical protein
MTACLLGVESRKGFTETQQIKTHPFVFAFFNLLFCAYYDQYLRGDADGHYLQLLFFINASIFGAIVAGCFMQSNREILLKSAVFPTTAWNRLLFTVLSMARRPFVLSLWSTTSLFLLVFYHKDIPLMISSVIMFTLMLSVLLLIESILFLAGVRSSRALSGIVPVLVLAAAGILICSVVFHFKPILAAIPVVSWSSNGILAVAQSDTFSFSVNLTLLLAVATGGVLVARKVC